MKFIQIIEYTTTKPDEVQAALDEFLASTGGKPPEHSGQRDDRP